MADQKKELLRVASDVIAGKRDPSALDEHGITASSGVRWASLQRRTFGVDVWTCHCGGKRKVLAVITSRRTAEEFLRNLNLLPAPSPPPRAQAPPQLQLAV